MSISFGANLAPPCTAKRQRVEKADGEDDLVSLGSGSEGEGDSSEDGGDEAEPGSHGDPKNPAERRAASRSRGSGGGALDTAALRTPVPPSRTFFTSAVARGGAGAQPNRKPGK